VALLGQAAVGRLVHLAHRSVSVFNGWFATSRPWMGWGSGGASLTGLSRATHAWDRLSAGTPAHDVTAVTAVPAP